MNTASGRQGFPFRSVSLLHSPANAQTASALPSPDSLQLFAFEEEDSDVCSEDDAVYSEYFTTEKAIDVYYHEFTVEKATAVQITKLPASALRQINEPRGKPVSRELTNAEPPAVALKEKRLRKSKSWVSHDSNTQSRELQGRSAHLITNYSIPLQAQRRSDCDSHSVMTEPSVYFSADLGNEALHDNWPTTYRGRPGATSSLERRHTITPGTRLQRRVAARNSQKGSRFSRLISWP